MPTQSGACSYTGNNILIQAQDYALEEKMNITDTASLARGAMVVDFAFSNGGQGLSLSTGEYIGIVAACLNRGMHGEDIEAELTKRVSLTVGQRAKETLEFFNHWHELGLWSQGPAIDDVKFHHKKLIAMFPEVKEANRRLHAGL